MTPTMSVDFSFEEEMKRKHSFLFRLAAALVVILAFLVTTGWSQSIVSGDVTGTVTDPSGAVIPGATVTLKSTDTGVSQTTTTNDSGTYRFALQKPGRYTVSVSQSGFAAASKATEVAVGQVTHADVKLSVTETSTTVEVNSQSPIIQTDNGNTQQSFNTAQIENLPAPGGDITYVVQQTPGIATNTSSGGGFGNFTANGVPATANLFTVNGNDEMDPYLNLNNSGASNLTIGANELAEATVTTNGFTGEFGRNAGAQVNYATKSGTNNFHGNAIYNWSGAALNAKDWFNEGPAPNTHDHQWAASFGGPIWKNRTFFFVNTEGINYTLPTSNQVFAPSAAYQASTLANLVAIGQGSQVPFYQKMFKLWNNAPGAANAVVDLNADPGGGIVSFRNAVTNSAHEWILSGRVDHEFSQFDHVFFRYKTDHGVQPTFTDPISPVFNAQSVQPAYEGQANWSHIFGNGSVNQFILSGSYFSAIFRPVDEQAARAAFPYGIFPAGPFTGLGGNNFAFPQGRNTGQFQLVDDYSKTIGNHSFKAGINFRHDNVTDFVYSTRSAFPLAELLTLDSFANGQFDAYIQRFPTRPTQPFTLYGLGFYGQDQWKVNSKLSVTFALRGDHNSNATCGTNCFAEAPTSFANLNHTALTPYNQVLQNGLSTAFHNLEAIAWQPRFGFAVTPFGRSSIAIRGGVGLFADTYPGTFAQFFSRNTPQVNSFTVNGGNVDPNSPGSAQALATAANTALLNVFRTGGNEQDLIAAETAAGVAGLFPALNVISPDVKNPKFIKWNLGWEQSLGSKNSFSIYYNGTHGRDIFVNNSAANAFCTAARCFGSAVAGLPSTAGPLSSRQSPVDPRFGTVQAFYNGGTSWYHGLTVAFQRRYSALQFNASYTWSHSLDNVSNGGLLAYSSNDSLLGQINPNCLDCSNYGNSDYDIRHYFQASWTFTPNWKFSNSFLNSALGGWTMTNTYFVRSALPFSVFDSTLSATIRNYGSELLLNYTPGFHGGVSCGRPNSTTDLNACFSPADFSTILGGAVADPAVGLNANQRRNQFRGTGYFDSDLSISKTMKVRENLRLGLSANAFNLFNHPNFANPVGDLGSSAFGTSISTVSPPTSPFGAFAGASASGRVLQIGARLNF